MKRIISIIMSFLSSLLGFNRLKEGVCVGKYFEPGRSERRTNLILVGKSLIPITTTVWEEEKYSLNIKGKDGKETLIEWHTVSKQVYDKTNEGDYVFL